MADLLTKAELKEARLYKWTAAAESDNPNVRAGTDHKKLDRDEGYEVLYFVNHYAAAKGLTKKSQGLAVATAIASAKMTSPNGHTHNEWRVYLDKHTFS